MTPSHDIPALAALIDARLHDSASPARTAIIAGVIIEYPTTAMEIGRGIGREEAAKVCDDRSAELARESTEKGSELILRDSLLAAGLATAIRALSTAVDVQGLIGRAMEAGHAAYNGAPDSHSQNVANVVRAVLSELGLGRVKE